MIVIMVDESTIEAAGRFRKRYVIGSTVGLANTTRGIGVYDSEQELYLCILIECAIARFGAVLTRKNTLSHPNFPFDAFIQTGVPGLSGLPGVFGKKLSPVTVSIYVCLCRVKTWLSGGDV
jgi:hypothetical protein